MGKGIEGYGGRKGRRTIAVAWWTRLDAGTLSPAERREFVAWLTADPENKTAFEDVCRVWGESELLRPLLAVRRPPPIRRYFRAGGVLAVALASLCFFFYFDDLSVLLRARELTGTAETKQLTLEDGSRVDLGPNSAIATKFTGAERRIVLLKGEAWFDVAPDASRPFSVAVSDATVTALGTAFDVSMERARTEVTVARHRVRISGSGPSIVVTEGLQSAFGPGVGPVAPYPVDIDQVTAWRRGKLIFDDKPLGEVISVLNRYHRGWILVIDPAIRTRRVTGVFTTEDPIAAIRAIEKSLGLRVTYVGSLVLLGS